MSHMAHSRPNDKTDPANWKDWDGQHECPECGDRCHNLVKEDEPIKDCLDHIEDGDLREHFRKELSEVYDRHYKRVVGLNDTIREKNARIEELESRLRYQSGAFGEISQIAAECLERNRG